MPAFRPYLTYAQEVMALRFDGSFGAATAIARHCAYAEVKVSDARPNHTAADGAPLPAGAPPRWEIHELELSLPTHTVWLRPGEWLVVDAPGGYRVLNDGAFTALYGPKHPDGGV